MPYEISEAKKEEWQEKAIENQKKAKELILSIGKSFTEDPTKIADLLEFSSNFYQYSLRNTELIYAQNRYASFVQSYAAWKQMDAHVKKGETGMKIWVPVKTTLLYLEDGSYVALSDATDEQKNAYKEGRIQGKKCLSYKIGTVFDIGQTDFPKERYPELFSMGYSSEEHKQIAKGLKEFSESIGCSIIYNDLSSISHRGHYELSNNRIVINSLLDDSEALSTLTHELGHMLENHGERDISASQKEFEADCISILIQSRYGIDITDTRKKHLSEHYKQFEKILMKENPSLTQEEKVAHIEEVLTASMKVFRQYAEQMDSYVKIAVEEPSIALEFDGKFIESFSYEVVECDEFPTLGNIYSDISSPDEALALFENIPDIKKSMIGGIHLVGKTSNGAIVDVVPILSGRKIDLDMLRYYPLASYDTPNKMIKDLVEKAKDHGFETYGSYEFSNHSQNMNAVEARKKKIC